MINTLGTCSKASVPIIVNAKPYHLFKLGKDTIICNFKNIVLNAGIGASSYLWSTGATSSTLTVDSAGVGNGSKTLWVMANLNGCLSYDTIKVTFVSCVGLKDYSFINGLEVYPNPSDGIFTVEIDKGKGMYELEILSLTGQKILKETINKTSTKILLLINMEHQSKGIYLLKINNGNEKLFKRIVLY